MTPPAAVAALRVRPFLLEGFDTVPAAQKPQSTLLKAAEGHLCQDWESDRGRLDRSLRIAGLEVRQTAECMWLSKVSVGTGMFIVANVVCSDGV